MTRLGWDVTVVTALACGTWILGRLCLHFYISMVREFYILVRVGYLGPFHKVILGKGHVVRMWSTEWQMGQ